MSKLTPEKVVAIFSKHGTHMSIPDASKVLDFLIFLAKLNIEQIEEDAAKKNLRIKTKKKGHINLSFSF